MPFVLACDVQVHVNAILNFNCMKVYIDKGLKGRGLGIY